MKDDVVCNGKIRGCHSLKCGGSKPHPRLVLHTGVYCTCWHHCEWRDKQVRCVRVKAQGRKGERLIAELHELVT
jgi:hypothetical protein